MRRKRIKATEIGNSRSVDGSTEVKMKRIVETVIDFRSTRHCMFTQNYSVFGLFPSSGF